MNEQPNHSGQRTGVLLALPTPVALALSVS
jgi:hypothetical protein